MTNSTRLTSNQDLQTSVYISLFSDRLALPSDILPSPYSDDRRGWWGDTYLLQDQTVDQIIGSRLWILSRSASYANLLLSAQQMCLESLAWMLKFKVAATVDVTTFFYPGPQGIGTDQSILGITVTIGRQSQPPVVLTFNYAWNQISP